MGRAPRAVPGGPPRDEWEPGAGERRDALWRRGSRSRRLRSVRPATGWAQARQLPDTVRAAGEHALHAVRTWSDPRERELRRRRRLRRRTVRLGTASGLTALGTAGMAAVSAPAWVLVVVAGGTAVLVTGAAVNTRRYLDARRHPLPPAAFVPRRLPPLRSRARAPIARLVRAERALHTVGRQITRGDRLPAEELADTLDTAGSGAAGLHALASDLVAMERAAEAAGRANPESVAALSEQVSAATARLTDGVAEYEQLVAAAGRILAVPEYPAVRENPAVSENPAVLEYPAAPDSPGRQTAELRTVADRLDGWAEALAELTGDPEHRSRTPLARPGQP